MEKKLSLKDDESGEPVESAETETAHPGLTASETKRALMRRMLANVHEQLEQVERLLESDTAVSSPEEFRMPPMLGSGHNSRFIEGVFDGEHMIGEDGERHLVPPNYASKSKLVEGDLLRLAITEDGRFVFKQRGPIERERFMGTLMLDEHLNEWKVLAEGKKYRVLTTSVSFFKAQPGDVVTILVPRGTPSRWAAIENLVKRGF